MMLTIFLTKNNQDKKNLNLNDNKYSYDIKNPKFTINSNKEKISINAKGASFINTDEILLEKNVIFISDKFTIKSQEVYFNRKNQTAYSKKNSTFISNGAKINSDGFEITNEGNIIEFNGKTKIVLVK